MAPPECTQRTHGAGPKWHFYIEIWNGFFPELVKQEKLAGKPQPIFRWVFDLFLLGNKWIQMVKLLVKPWFPVTFCRTLVLATLLAKSEMSEAVFALGLGGKYV